jgi:crotonobetainyl-CoA:carnitine CoA-transferase CaiB-like acyl-CoA transferase
MTDHLRAHETAAPMADHPTGPLVGFRILDVTHAAAGPYGTMMLADLGADVIKVEPPTGELVRFGGPHTLDDEVHAYSGRFANRNRNKRSIALDLADPEDQETFLQLVETADGLVENMRAGVLERLGVGWEVCHARNPKLVYAAVRGFGDPITGASPYGDWPAFDVVAQAVGGFVSMTGPDASHPMRTGPAVGDYVPGLMAALGLLAAFLHAQRTGEGQFVDVAMVDGLMSMCEVAQMLWTYKGADCPPTGNSVDGISPFAIYPAADGHCAIAAPTDAHWALLCEAIGRSDLIDDPRTAKARMRIRSRPLVDEVLGNWTSQRTMSEVVEALGGKVSVGPVLDPRRWVDDPHVAAREMLVRVEHGASRPTVQLNCPIKLTATPSGIYRRPPHLDEHGDELRKELDARRQQGADRR